MKRPLPLPKPNGGRSLAPAGPWAYVQEGQARDQERGPQGANLSGEGKQVRTATGRSPAAGGKPCHPPPASLQEASGQRAQSPATQPSYPAPLPHGQAGPTGSFLRARTLQGCSSDSHVVQVAVGAEHTDRLQCHRQRLPRGSVGGKDSSQEFTPGPQAQLCTVGRAGCLGLSGGGARLQAKDTTRPAETRGRSLYGSTGEASGGRGLGAGVHVQWCFH